MRFGTVNEGEGKNSKRQGHKCGKWEERESCCIGEGFVGQGVDF